MAIHLPLSPGRISAFSTHTAHPEFVRVLSTALGRLLGFTFDVENPFLYRTKSEVLQPLLPKHKKAAERSVSCWKASRVGRGKSHCGFCVPCLLRRIAFEDNGVRVEDYDRDLLSEMVGALPPDDDGKRNLSELAEFSYRFSISDTASLVDQFPELTGPDVDLRTAVEMYKRAASQTLGVLRQYPGPQAILPSAQAAAP
jgi:hypothetical protein